MHLAGAGAVGQAAVLTWRATCVTGQLLVVDPQRVDLGNLQRYVLTNDTSVGEFKTHIVAQALTGTGLTVEQVTARWGATWESRPGRHTVAVALDTADDRIGVAAGVHQLVYNAWTDPTDLGWSRHETFGADQPCLACLYWPRGPKPSLHEQIAAALGQDPLRIRMYLLADITLAGIPAQIIPRPGEPLPAEAERWIQRSLLEDLVAEHRLQGEQAAHWAHRHIRDLWSEGICGGTVVIDRSRGEPASVQVPLAHQSALAGIMLAAQVIMARDPALARVRDVHCQGRLDVLTTLPQIIGRPRLPRDDCLCRDSDFQSSHVASHNAVAQWCLRIPEGST